MLKSNHNAPASVIPDPFLRERYHALHATPMQSKLRAIRPWPVGVVFIERPGMSLGDIREHFRVMRSLGFNCLKQCELCPTTDRRAVLHSALDEGIIPWWYGEAGWEEPVPSLLRSLGLKEDMPAEELRVHPKWLSRQDAVMRARIDRRDTPPKAEAAHETDGLPGTLKRDEFGLTPESAGLFTAWLKRRYGSVAVLKKAWNFDHSMVNTRPWRNWAEVRADVSAFVSTEKQEYRRMADVLRFRADAHLKKIACARDAHLAYDADVPFRTGGEMGLFLPFAARSTDMEGLAGLMADGGSFYPSIHPGWHFEEADFEFAKPIYMQASLATDWFKGGWAASWESTGGPQQLSGGKAPFVAAVREQVAGFTIDENTIQQLMLSWVAGGFKGFGQWCWNARSFGWEAGEYALLDRNQKPCPRTVAAGKIGKACTRLRDELWAAAKEPSVGLFQDFEADSFYAAIAVGGRDMYKDWPQRARIGAARALIDANVPWEHVTAANLRAGLADRYPIIYFSAPLAIDSALLVLLRDYVERGGRVVIDAPAAWYGYDGCLLPTDDNSVFERLFGVRIGDFQYSRGNHVTWSLGRKALEGFVLELQPTTAVVVDRFSNSAPAVTENRIGRGSAVVIGHEASLGCCRPGQSWLQARLLRYVLGGHRSPYSCEGAIAYRLAAPDADHFFLINDEGSKTRAKLSPTSYHYSAWEDAVTQEPLPIGKPVTIPSHGARWIRCRK